MADAQANTTVTQTTETRHIIYIWKIPVDKTYVLSLNSAFKIAATFLSLIAFVCVAAVRYTGCEDAYSSSYNYFEFVSISAFLTLIIFWFLYTLTLTRRLCMKLLPWVFIDLIYCTVYIILYIIADIVLAVQSCENDSKKAGCAFGFFALFCIIANAVALFLDWRRARQEAGANAGRGADYNPDRNMEQY